MNDLSFLLRGLVAKESNSASTREWDEAQSQSKNPLYDYGGNHVELVTATALHSARQEGADEDMVMMAGWLHTSRSPDLVVRTTTGQRVQRGRRRFCVKQV